MTNHGIFPAMLEKQFGGNVEAPAQAFGRESKEERFLSAEADPFAGAKGEERRRPAPFEMTGEGGSRGPYLAFTVQREYTLISL
jgi:hypothetical protein